MSYKDIRKKENEKIPVRTIKIQLSDNDCQSLLRKCGEHGLTIAQLFENVVYDLVGSGNGSDERDLINSWFNRCFGTFSEQTLLSHLLYWGYDPEDYLDILDNIATAEEDKKYFEEHPEDADEEAQYIDDDVADWEEELKSMRVDWKPTNPIDMEKEIVTLKNWITEKENLLKE